MFIRNFFFGIFYCWNFEICWLTFVECLERVCLFYCPWLEGCEEVLVLLILMDLWELESFIQFLIIFLKDSRYSSPIHLDCPNLEYHKNLEYNGRTSYVIDYEDPASLVLRNIQSCSPQGEFQFHNLPNFESSWHFCSFTYPEIRWLLQWSTQPSIL